MAYLVQLPTGQRIQFPDEVSREEAYRLITERYYPDQSPILPPPAPPTTIGGELMEVLKGLPRGAAGLLETAASGAAALLPDQAERELRGEITDFFRPVQEGLAPAAGYEESIGAKAGEALGSTLPFLAAGPLGVAGRIGATGLGVAAGAGEARLRAEQEGGMEDRGAATALGALVGATEVIPIFRILNRLPEKEVLGTLDYVKRAAAAGGEEFAQEASANVAQNLIEKGLYNPEQEVFEGAAEEGAYGFGVGAFIQGLTDLAMGRRVRGGVEPPGGEDELAGIGAEQTLAGADTGGSRLPVSRIGAAGPDVEGTDAAGMGVPSDVAGRIDEGAEALQPALKFQRGEEEPEIKTQTVYRGGSQSTFGLFPKDMTADDVIRYEIEELGNEDSTQVMPGIDLKSIPARSLDWVTFDEASAQRYADPDLEETVESREETFRVVAKDDEGGYLIQRLPAPEVTLPKSSAVAFEPAKLEELRVPEYKSREKLIEMPIDDFLALAKPGRMKIKEDEVTKLLEEETKFSSVPFLYAYPTKEGTLKVEGHEGRHRARALKAAGYETMPVIIKSDIRWSEQDDPSKRDYMPNWPTKIVAQEGNFSIPMPISREQSLAPYEIQQPISEVPTAPKVPLERVQTAVQEATQGWTNAPKIIVAQNADDPVIPETMRRQIPTNARGFYDRGSVYVLADRAPSESAVRGTVFHESLGHYGLEQLFRSKLDQTLDSIYKTNTAVKAEVNNWIKQHPDAYAGPNQAVRAVEEILAGRAEKGVIKQPGIRAAFNRLAAMIRKFIRAMGLKLDYSNNDIDNVLREAADRVRTQPGPVFNTDASPRFQISQYNKVLSNVLEQNQKLPEWSQSVGDGVVNAMSRMPENLRKTQFYIYSMPQTIELLERYVPRIRAIDRFIGYRASYTTDLMKTASDNHAKYTDAVQAYPDKFNEFNNVINDINLFQVQVRDQAVIDLLSQPRASLNDQKKKYYDIAKRFYDLPVRLQNSILSQDGTSGLFADYRKMGDKKFEIFSQVYGGQLGMGVVKNLRERFEKERLPMYAPLVRGEGAHWLYYETTDGRQSKEVFPSEAAREVAIRKAIEEGRAKADTIVRATRASEIRDKGPPPTGFLAQVVERLESTMPNTIPADVRRQIIDGVYDTFISSLPSEMLRQELSSRQTFEVDGAMQFGVLGFDQDALAVYERQMPKMAYQLGNLKFALPIENAMKKVMEQAKMYEIAVRENNIPQRLQGRKLMPPKAVYDGVEDMRRRLDFAYNPTYAPWVNGIATANYIYSIAGNVSSALINTTVLLMMTLPSLVGKYGTMKSIGAMTRAMKMFAEGGVDDQGNFTFGNAATGEAKTFFDYLTKRGVIGIAAEQELRQAQRAKIGGYQTTFDKINYVMGYVFKNSERFNREVTMLASFMLAREKGKSFKTAAEEAIRLNNNINGTVLPESASRLYQTNLGRVILTFRTFALTQIINLSRMFGRALNAIDATPEERSIARKQMLGVFGMTYMVAGLKGLPLFSAAEVLAAALMGDDDEPYDLQQEVIDSLGLLGLNGPLNAAFNVDIASRTGFNGMLWRDDPKRLAELGFVYYAIDRIAGPTAGLVQAQVRGFENLANGEIQRGFESILPAPIRNPLKAARYATEGALTKSGQPIVDNVDTWNQVMQVFGFAPAELAATQEQIGTKFVISDKLRNRRTALLTNLYTAITTGDSQATEEAFEAINNFNGTNPMIGIDSRSIIASFRERSRRAGESINGIYLPQKLLMTTDEYMADLN